MKRYIWVLLFPLILISPSFSLFQPEDKPIQHRFTNLYGAYLGQPLPIPGDSPKLFAPGIVSTGFYEKASWFNPDGKEFYYCMYGEPMPVILYMKNINGEWTSPEIASFSDQSAGEFTMSPDGKKILFLSNRPVKHNQQELEKTANFWTATRKSLTDEWSKPRLMDEPFRNFGYICAANSGNLYFFDYELDGFGKADLFMSKYIEGKYSEPINLGKTINSEYYDVDPYIAPDESYIIFSSDRIPSGLYISYRDQDNNWTVAQYLGDKINSNTGDGPVCASVTPDGKYLFFTANPKTKKLTNRNFSYQEKVNFLNSPGNGLNDIYWVSADIIARLRPNKN